MQRLLNLIVLTACILFAGCQSKKKISWNDAISKPLKQEIKIKNDRVLQSLAENKPSDLKKIFSDTLIKQTAEGFNDGVSKMHESVSTKDYTVLDEYFVENISTGFRDTVSKNDSEKRAYKVTFEVLSKESYVSILLHDTPENQLLILCIYGKYNGDWKLEVLRIGRYSIFKRTAPDIYEPAKIFFDQGDLLDAANISSLIQQTLTPAYPFFHYEKEPEIKEFLKKVLTEAGNAYNLPMSVPAIKSTPQIFNIRLLPLKEGIFPVVTYITKFNLRDSSSIKKENDALQLIIGNLFHGIEKNNKYIFFQAYHETPGIEKAGDHIEFIMKGRVK